MTRACNPVPVHSCTVTQSGLLPLTTASPEQLHTCAEQACAAMSFSTFAWRRPKRLRARSAQLKQVLMAVYFGADHVVWASQAGLYTNKQAIERCAPCAPHRGHAVLLEAPALWTCVTSTRKKASLHGWRVCSVCDALA